MGRFPRLITLSLTFFSSSFFLSFSSHLFLIYIYIVFGNILISVETRHYMSVAYHYARNINQVSEESLRAILLGPSDNPQPRKRILCVDTQDMVLK